MRLYAVLDMLPARVGLLELLKVLSTAREKARSANSDVFISVMDELLERRRRRVLKELTKWTREAWLCCADMGWYQGIGAPMVDHLWGLVSILDGIIPSPNPLSGPAKFINFDFDFTETFPDRELEALKPRRGSRP